MSIQKIQHLLLVAITLLGFSCASAEDTFQPRSLYPYSFGDLDKVSVDDAVALVTKHGYSGITANARGEKSLKRLSQYIAKSEELGDSFKVYSVHLAHRFDQYGFDVSNHFAAIDIISGKKVDGKQMQLWVWFRDRDGTVSEEQLEEVIRKVLTYAESKDVQLVLYPHENNMMLDADDAFAMAERINHPNLGIAYNLTHELNENHDDQIEEIYERVKSRVVAMTVSGVTDEVKFGDLGKSTYDHRRYMRMIKNSDFKGPIGYINFQLTNPPDYLKRGIDYWNALCKEVGLTN